MSALAVTDAPVAIVDEVLIAGGAGPRHRSRAGVALLPDGQLFVPFRVGWDMFGKPHGAVVGTWSADGGRSWEEPLPLCAEPGWDWFGAQRLLQLADGSLAMLAGRARWNTELFFTHATRSQDGGRTWAESGPAIAPFAIASEPYGGGIALPDGKLVMGYHGQCASWASASAGVAFSPDGGMTWSGLTLIAADSELALREPDLLMLGDGRLLAVIRTDTPPCESYRSYSADDGQSWSPIESTGFKGHCPRLFQLRRGILCVYRDMEDGRPGLGYSVSRDEGRSWEYGGVLYRSPGPYSGWATACGYPALVQLGSGAILCVFHTDFGADRSEIRGLFLRDQTATQTDE